jgi:dihydroorotase
MANVLLRNARLVDPAADIDGLRDVLVCRGRVNRVAEEIQPDEALRRLRAGGEGGALTCVDADGLWLWPGLVDAHVHFREPGFTQKETLHTGGMAAAAGGYSSVVCEPNTDPPVDSVALVRRLAEQADRECAVRVYFKAAMTKGRRGEELSDIAALAEERRVVALSDDGDPVADAALMDGICRMAARARIMLAPHCEDSERSLKAVAAGARPGFEPGEPYRNEANYVERDLLLAARHGCRIHVSHVSLAPSVETVERARSGTGRPGHVSCEATPHHLLLCAEDFPPGAAPKVNPPLRSARDREALCQALASGRVDAVASDHAPHTEQDKATGAYGLVGLETTLGLVLTRFVHAGKLSAADAVRALSLSPARIFGLPAGTLTPGSPADMVLVDPGLEWTVRPEEFRSRSRNTPFGGWRLRGRAVATYVAGNEAFSLPSFEARKSG